MDTSFQLIRGLASEATLTAEGRDRIAQNLSNLPGLYEELQRTSESRFRDKIKQQIESIIKVVRESPNGGTLADGILDQI